MARVTTVSFEAKCWALFSFFLPSMEAEKAQLDSRGWTMLSADPSSIIHFLLRVLASFELGSSICFSELITNEEKKEVKASVRWGLASLQSRHMACILMREFTYSGRIHLKGKLTGSRPMQCCWLACSKSMAHCLVKAACSVLTVSLGLGPCLPQARIMTLVPSVTHPCWGSLHQILFHTLEC